MATVALRVYNHEIEGMIENGQLEEAIAHCQNILKSFPMHVETYRLLGKSFLESKRYADAADIFQRTLMAVPDDFVSHVGMSIIRDDENKLDDAIWHMERAFEDQPSNPAIQGELRRLYGRRDGVEPSKIRLSRDALANMYSQGELFNQAIAEIRAVLAEDTNRPDLQVMLARAYFRAGQKVEAAEMAANLLKKYPYCMDALRILVDVLPGSSRADDAQVYQQRIQLLDPYSSLTNETTFNTEQVADMAVTLDRLDYIEGITPPSQQPDWAASLGIKMADEKRSTPIPAWMETSEPTQPPPNVKETPNEPTKTPPSGNESVPEWMRSAGWQESNGNEPEGSAVDDENQQADPIAKAEIPDWLKSMAPQEIAQAVDETDSSKGNTPAQGEEEDPDWLAGLGIAAPEATLESNESSTPYKENNAFPDWLKEIGDSPAAETVATTPSENSDQPPLTIPTESTPPSPTPPPAQESVRQPVSTSRMDDDTPFQPTGESKPLNIEDDALAWLESLAAKQGAKEEELLIKPTDRTDEMPDWLRSTDEKPSAAAELQPPLTPPESLSYEPPEIIAGEPTAQSPLTSEGLPPDTTSAEETTQPSKIEDEVEFPHETMTAEQEIQGEELPPQSVETYETPPDWIRKMGLESAATEEKLSPETPENDITITTWLRKQDVEEALGKIPPLSDLSQPASTPSDELPDWLKDLEKPETPKEAQIGDENLPDWIRQPEKPADQERPVNRANELGEEIDLSAWMDETIPVSESPAPTTSEDWIPADEKPTPKLEPEPTPKLEPEPAPKQVPEPAPKLKPEPALKFEPALKPAEPEVEPPIHPHFPRGTGALATIPSLDKDAELLKIAQDALGANQLNEAMQAYSRLIKKNRLLNEVIQDLREAIYRFPVDSIVWQTLGDASMRANRLQDALDAYTKAEELLR